jgi:hypothetical protein
MRTQGRTADAARPDRTLIAAVSSHSRAVYLKSLASAAAEAYSCLKAAGTADARRNTSKIFSFQA